MSGIDYSPAGTDDESTANGDLDPEALIERDAVTTAERTYEHEDTEHCEADAAGRVAVGVTDAEGAVLVLVNRADSHALLPNCPVDPDEKWLAVARRTVEETTGVPVVIEEPRAVRRVEHTVEGTDEVHSEGHHVVFAASVDRDRADEAADPTDPDLEGWTAGWYHELPVDVDADEAGDALADVRAFLD